MSKWKKNVKKTLLALHYRVEELEKRKPIIALYDDGSASFQGTVPDPFAFASYKQPPPSPDSQEADS
jgi:hypothetical protein